MKRFRCFARCFVLIAVWGALAASVQSRLVGAASEALPAVDDKWRYFQSANFELYSRNNEGESRDLLQSLELLRAVCLERLNYSERARLDVTVFYFRSPEDFRAYSAPVFAKNEFFRGYYLARRDRAVIALSPMSNPEADRRLIFHEYVHHVFRIAEEDPPVWYNEGMAEFLGGMRQDGKSIEIGRPQLNRLAALRGEKLLPLETLFAVTTQSPIYRSSDHTGVFYAQSWALLHYLYCGESDIPAAAVERFLRVASHRKTAAAADLRGLFRECFGFDYPEMQRRLQKYIEDGTYRYSRQPTPKTEPVSTYAMRPVGRDEIRTRLAELALRVNRAPVGKYLLLESIEKNPADPRPFEVLGMEALNDRDENGARERWEKAVELGSRNVAIFRELDLLESRTWFQQFNYNFRLAADVTERLRGRLKQSIAISPQQTAAYEMLAWVEAFAEEPSTPNVNLVQGQFARLREKQRTLLALAFVRVRIGKGEEAKKLLDQLDQMEPDRWTAQAAEVVRAKAEGRPVRRSAPPTPNRFGGPGPVVPPVSAPPFELPNAR